MILTGQARLGRDVSVKYLQSGTAIAELPIVYNYGMKGDDGNYPSQWVTANIFGKQAEGLGPFFKKGSSWDITLKNVRVETWEKKDGSGTGQKLVGDVVNISFGLTNRTEGGTQEPRQAPQQRTQAPAPNPSTAANLADMDDDIPF